MKSVEASVQPGFIRTEMVTYRTPELLGAVESPIYETLSVEGMPPQEPSGGKCELMRAFVAAFINAPLIRNSVSNIQNIT